MTLIARIPASPEGYTTEVKPKENVSPAINLKPVPYRRGTRPKGDASPAINGMTAGDDSQPELVLCLFFRIA